MKTLLINGTEYTLPESEEQVLSVLNHIDMVKIGRKQFVKLTDMQGNQFRFFATYLNNAEILIQEYIEESEEEENFNKFLTN